MCGNALRLCLTATALITAAWAQGGASAPLPAREVPLRMDSETPTGTGSGAVILPVRCDEDGNLYFRRLDLSKGPSAREPVIQLRADGQIKANFSIESAPDLPQKLSIRDFTVVVDGDLYMLATFGAAEPHILRFSSDGKFIRATKLEGPIVAGKFAVLRSGEFLVTGTVPPSTKEPVGETPITMLYDRDGKRLRKLTLPMDRRIGQQPSDPSAKAPDYVAATTRLGNFAVSLGVAVTGTDGNIYLLRKTTPLLVYVISPAGELLRTITVPSEKEIPVGQLFYAHGNLAVASYSQDESTPTKRTLRLRIIDAGSGEVRTTYTAEPLLGRGLACYTGDDFVFLGTKEGRMVIRRASAK